MFVSIDGNHTAGAGVTLSTTTGLTFTRQQNYHGNRCTGASFTAPGGSGGTGTVTATWPTAANSGYLTVLSYSNVDTTTPLGASGTNNVEAANFAVAVTPTYDNSVIVAQVSSDLAANTSAANTVSTKLGTFHDTTWGGEHTVFVSKNLTVATVSYSVGSTQTYDTGIALELKKA